MIPVESLPGEEWRPVVGYEGFFAVSSRGRVASLARHRVPTTRLLRPSLGNDGYPEVNFSIAGVKSTKKVHRLVALAFLGPRPDGLQIRHLDGNRRNSVLANLAYGTASENMHDAVRHGMHPQASKTHCPAGHPYDEVNTRRVPSHPTYRYCRTCQDEMSRLRKRRMRALAKQAA